MTEIRLKPCPFCGADAQLYVIPYSALTPLYEVECTRCSAKIGRFKETYQASKGYLHFTSEQEAAEAWNKRAELPSAQPEVITCIDCIHYTPFGNDKAWGRCSVNQRMCQSCDFCAWAERREEDG